MERDEDYIGDLGQVVVGDFSRMKDVPLVGILAGNAFAFLHDLMDDRVYFVVLDEVPDIVGVILEHQVHRNLPKFMFLFVAGEENREGFVMVRTGQFLVHVPATFNGDMSFRRIAAHDHGYPGFSILQLA